MTAVVGKPPLSEADSLSDAAALGLPALARLVAHAGDGIVVVDHRRRYVYANASACEVLGYDVDELVGRDFLTSFPEREHDALLEQFPRQFAGSAAPFTTTVVRPDGTEREIISSNSMTEINGEPHGVAIFRDTTAIRQAARSAAALGQTAAQLAGSSSVQEILAAVAFHAVDTTRAVGCGIALLGPDGKLAVAGGYGLPIEFGDAVLAGTLALEDLPEGDVLLTGRTTVVADARARWAEHPATAPMERLLADLDWQASVYVPMSWRDEVFGVFGVYLPSGIAAPTEEELVFYTALTDQAAVAVTNSRLLTSAQEAAALRERGRLARDLHDSVSQALFSMTLQARAAQLALGKAGLSEDDRGMQAVAEFRALTQGALAEMRALIFELRPGALAEEGLVAAVRKSAAAITARDGLQVEITGPEARLPLSTEQEEHLYRIVQEALHNAVKHAAAATVAVTVRLERGRVSAEVCDDGVGFDAGAEYPGHLGLQTMAERAGHAGGWLTIESTPGAGTTVTVELDTSGSRP